MGKLVLSLVLLLVILIFVSVGVWILAKNFRLTIKFRIYLVGTVVLIITAIFASLFISGLTDRKNNDTNNKEEVVFEL